jgi:hypothetical protein
MHCPKIHEKFSSSFGNAEVISSDRRKLFINIFSKTTWNLLINLEGILKKYCAKALKSVGTNLQPLPQDANTIPLYHFFRIAIMQKKITLLRKWP